MMDEKSASNPLYSELQKLLESPKSSLIGFLWGLAEATLFFIVPDVYLGFVGLVNWRRGLLAMLWTVLGAILGGAAMYLIASQNSEAAILILQRIPLISPDMIDSVGDQLRTEGLYSLLIGLFQGVPYKIYAVQAGVQKVPIVAFLLMTIPARLARILPVTVIAGIVGVGLRSFIQRRTVSVISIYVFIWIGIYVMYIFLVN